MNERLKVRLQTFCLGVSLKPRPCAHSDHSWHFFLLLARRSHTVYADVSSHGHKHIPVSQRTFQTTVTHVRQHLIFFLMV